MNNLTTSVNKIFNDSLNALTNDSNCSLHDLISDNLITTVSCNFEMCSDNLTEFSQVFNTGLKASQNTKNEIKAFISENEDIYHRIEAIFQHSDWSTNYRIRNFNLATSTTSRAKCTIDSKFYIIKCYDHFYYIYNTESNYCLMAVKNEKKALTMINILLLTPYLLYGDLYAVHGGLVSDGKNNILLSNSSLGGKTTFALLFLEHRWQIITEETTYITKYGEILNYNIRNYFNIRIGTYLEFKDIFATYGIINNSFLAMLHKDKEELFELGKKEQMSIYYDDLCKNKESITTKQITHVLKVSLEKNKSGLTIEKSRPTENIDRFLELSVGPTVMLFKNLTKMTTMRKNKRKEELIQIFKDVKSFSVSSGFDYRKNFNFLIKGINTL